MRHAPSATRWRTSGSRPARTGRRGAELHALAHEAAGGRWVATGGGGYQWARVVPRAWTTYFAEMAGAEIPDDLPEAWIERTEFLLRAEVPVTMSEPPSRRAGATPRSR